MIEQAHRQLKDTLQSRLACHKWVSHLPWVLLGLRATPKEDDNVSSAELVFGSLVTVPCQFLNTPELPSADFLEGLQATRPLPTRQWSYAVVTAAPPPALTEADFVYIRKGGSVPPLSPPYDGPFALVDVGQKFFTVNIGNRRETVSVVWLKPHTGPSPPSLATPL
jgi:hypothetical protein